MKLINIWLLFAIHLVTFSACSDPAAERHIYYTHGVHNDKRCGPDGVRCISKRLPGEPSDPQYPQWWMSEWTMYRVFQNYDKFPPPYASPPQGLTPADYEVSHGATYYDNTYQPADGDGSGAMREHYEKRCLPIFPMKNDFTCSFVSLGNKAYFLRYADRPAGTPPCCKFSPKNHPPRTDFIKHLPYNAQDSTHLNNSLQAYSMTVGPQKILFGYAFYKTTTPDTYDRAAAPYRHPQSFYFSGYPAPPADAPIVSQNYENFRMQQPPAETWQEVATMCPKDPEWCCLFASDCPDKKPESQGIGASWSELEPKAE